MFNPNVLTKIADGSADKPAFTFGSNPVFMKTFNKLLNNSGQSQKKNTPGTDVARGLGQQMAKLYGGNKKTTPPTPVVNPISAAMQHSVRNLSTEQGGGSASSSLGGGGAGSSVLNFLLKNKKD